MESARTRFYNAGFVVFICILFALGIWLLHYIAATISILITSILLAYILLPMVNFFEKPIIFSIPQKLILLGKEISITPERREVVLKKRGSSRVLSIVIVYLILALVMAIMMSFVVPNVSNEFNKFVRNLPATKEMVIAKINLFNVWLQPRLPENARDIIPRSISEYSSKLETYIYQAAQHILFFIQKVLETALAILIIPIFTFYILMDLETFKKGFRAVIPRHRRDEIMSLMARIDVMLGRFIRGQIVVGLFLAVGVTLCLLFLGIDYAFLIGLISGFTNFIPYLGVIISLVPALTLALLSKGLWTAFLVFVTLEIVHQMEAQVISPAVMGEAVGLPPLVIILAIIAGGQAMGFIGMLVAIPIVAAVRVIVNFYNEKEEEAEAREAENQCPPMLDAGAGQP